MPEWVSELLKGLPASLIFIFVVDWRLLSDLVELYHIQLDGSDTLGFYTLIAIMSIVLVNLIIIIAYARQRFLIEKQIKTPLSAEVTQAQ